MSSTDPYFDIRPFHDDEVPAAIERLIADKDFTNAIIKSRYPKLQHQLGWLLRPLIRFYLARKWKKIRSVRDVQDQVRHYMDAGLKQTSDGVTYSGLDKLDPNQSYLFISNHRDIAMDPALVNWGLYHDNRDTVRIAIGDNLLRMPCATDLMKLNKSFIVKRSAKGPRELMKVLGQLSSYIRHSLDEGQSIWLAQREGRAKDGNDKTDPAILKMLHVEGRKQKVDFGDYVASLRIVPVSIAYENDPCDRAKAKELAAVANHGFYEKGEFEDIQSIIHGIVGEKRRVHLHFGDVVGNQFETPEALAQALDQQIMGNYKLYPVNYIAAEQPHPLITDEERKRFAQKLDGLSEQEQSILKAMYANPVLNQANATRASHSVS